MHKHTIGDRVVVKLSGGRIVEATIRAIIDTTDGVRLHVSFGDETALIYLWSLRRLTDIQHFITTSMQPTS
jgi:hypothetical protein